MKFIFLVFVLFISQNSIAFVNCFGKITNVYLAKNGELTLHTTWRNNYLAVCSVNSDWKGVSAEVCKGWLSIAQTAQVTQEQTVIQYGALDSCSEVGSYSSAPSPNYLMLYGSE